MDLHFSLLVAGLVVIAIIFVMSRYSNVLENMRDKYKDRLLRKRQEAEVLKRDAKNAPRLNGAEHEEEQFDAPLFDFSSDSINGEQSETSDTLYGDEARTGQPTEQVSQVEQTENATLLDAEEEEHSGPFTSLRQIDYWIKLSPREEHTQAQILAALEGWDKLNFPVQLHALTLDNPQWVSLLDTPSDTRVMDVVASYQLLDKGAATTFEDLQTFDSLVSALGKTLKAEKLMMATPEQALEQSERLAQFYLDNCEPLEVSISAPKSQAFMGKLVETSAKQQGLEFVDGEYVRLKPIGSEKVALYRMRPADAGKFERDMSSNAMTKRVIFSMMPALSSTPGRDAKEMLDAVKAFASRVKGEIRVPGKSEFHLDQLLNLRNRVSQLEQEMKDAGLEPGGPELHRIFSQ